VLGHERKRQPHVEYGVRRPEFQRPPENGLGNHSVPVRQPRDAEAFQDRGIARVAFDRALDQRDRLARVPARQPDHPEQMQGLGMAGGFPKDRAAQAFRARKVPGLEAADGVAEFPLQSA